jgi:hypothetical protein
LPWKTLVRAKDRGTKTTLALAAGDIFTTTIQGAYVQTLRYDVMPLLSMDQLLKSPSSAEHGTLKTMARHIYRGKTGVEYLKKTESRDLAAAEQDNS